MTGGDAPGAAGGERGPGARSEPGTEEGVARLGGDGGNPAARESGEPPAAQAAARDLRGATAAAPGVSGGPRRRWRLRAVLAALFLLAALDQLRAPADQLSARALLAGIDAYQATLSPRLGRAGVRCRFQPSCSRYAEGAIRADGAVVGSLRATWRILRCGPWTPQGTVDPP